MNAREIRDEILNSPPFQKHQIIENYKGLKVEWVVKYESAHPPKDNKLHVMTLYEGNYPWVYFDIDLDDYPVFKIAKKGAKFIVIGKIIDLDGGTFTLKTEKIFEN